MTQLLNHFTLLFIGHAYIQELYYNKAVFFHFSTNKSSESIGCLSSTCFCNISYDTAPEQDAHVYRGSMTKRTLRMYTGAVLQRRRTCIQGLYYKQHAHVCLSFLIGRTYIQGLNYNRAAFFDKPEFRVDRTLELQYNTVDHRATFYLRSIIIEIYMYIYVYTYACSMKKKLYYPIFS